MPLRETMSNCGLLTQFLGVSSCSGWTKVHYRRSVKRVFKESWVNGSGTLLHLWRLWQNQYGSFLIKNDAEQARC